MLAKDIMRKDVVTVGAELTVRELAQLFIERRITGAPVVDPEGKLLGVVSQTDIVRRDREASASLSSEVPVYYTDPDSPRGRQGLRIEDPDYSRVSDVMTPMVISAPEGARIQDLAKLMLQKHIHRVIITRGGRLRGIVTAMDMLRALLELLKEPAPAGLDGAR